MDKSSEDRCGVYKIVWRCATDSPNEYALMSAFVIGRPFEIEYKINAWTYPPEGYADTWLVAFYSKESALEFTPQLLTNLSNLGPKLYVAQGYRTAAPEIISRKTDSESMRRWYGNPDRSKNGMPPPPNSVFCSRIKLIREVTREELLIALRNNQEYYARP